MRIISADIEPKLSWLDLIAALAEGHKLPPAEIADTFLYRGEDTLLTRSAWIDRLGLAVKPATVFPGNKARGLAGVNGAVTLFDDKTGLLSALVDFHVVTKWKTAGDSLLAASRLARKDAREVLILGAGNVAASMVSAYRALIPEARITIWNRSPAAAEKLADSLGCTATPDLEPAVRRAEVIATTTMAREPLIRGAWLQPGTHLDLIGAFRPDMREVDDEAMRRARVFVDSRRTTIGHIGEIDMPLKSGAISEADIVADFYELDAFTRADDDITIAKNGGGAHLDLMTAAYIRDIAEAAG